MSGFWNDLKHGCRVLAKTPGFALSAIVVLALGIGANTAIFGIVNGVLLRPLPFGEPDRLVQLWHTPPQKEFPGVSRFALSAANYLDWEAQNTVFSSSAVYRYWQFRLTGAGDPQILRAARVEPTFFSVLATRPLLGRAIDPSDDVPDRHHVVVLSYRRLEFSVCPAIHKLSERRFLSMETPTPSSASCRPRSSSPNLRPCGCRLCGRQKRRRFVASTAWRQWLD